MDQKADPQLDPEILSYYNRRPEETRLERGLSQLEAIRTRELIERHVPPAPATVLDVGGAAGAYAGWLAEMGYEVHLVDAVPRLVDEARARSASLSRPIASCEVGDARSLIQPDASVDVVLLLGPLYHLTISSDRARALAEAARVLRPGGVLFAAAISRWASILDALVYDLFADPFFEGQVEREVSDGQHRNPEQHAGFFTTAYFHRPEELREEVTAAGFQMVALCGIEGPARMLADFDERWSDPRRRGDMLRVARLLESEPALLGLSPHLLAVARKWPRR
ncbi:MAG TPA: methyltransferase domain-containing protein [Gemmatimonadaceae bacterium]|jgi:ubiquinone/menaquinone biosynthesis C-methylase UbiE|nr:methyltransferase domain-containing protein [Gemmatimonadaceae bacterium]